jgi:hypothetical protein
MASLSKREVNGNLGALKGSPRKPLNASIGRQGCRNPIASLRVSSSCAVQSQSLIYRELLRRGQEYKEKQLVRDFKRPKKSEEGDREKRLKNQPLCGFA